MRVVSWLESELSRLTRAYTRTHCVVDDLPRRGADKWRKPVRASNSIDRWIRSSQVVVVNFFKKEMLKKERRRGGYFAIIYFQRE